MVKEKKRKLVFFALTLCFLFAFCIFYYKYVPLIKSFQLALVPILFIMLLLTAVNIRWGILSFIFAFPLVNNLPYFFGIQSDVPHAPTAVVLFLAFFLGWLIRNSFSKSLSDIDRSVYRPLVLLSLIIFVSGIITFFRYANFFPFHTEKIYELVVNGNGVRVGGAHMSGVFVLLNYLTGFLFFFILMSVMKSREFAKKALIVLSVSTLITLLFSLVQKYISSDIGNTTFFAGLDHINSTFKDPNSFGLFLSGFVPVLLGLAFCSRKKARMFFIFLIAFALFVFPSLGSRSAFLALIVAFGTFVLLSFLNFRIPLKRKIVYAVSFLSIAAIVFLSFFFFARQSKLYERLHWSMRSLDNTGSFYNLFTGKPDLWRVASKMIADYPLTGVGLGAYIVELPNYADRMDLDLRLTDSAENYYFQAGAELGLVGLALFLWLLFEIARQMRKSWKASRDDNDRFILFGAISGIVATICISLIFHSYIGAFDAKYFFWFLVALVFLFPKEEKSSGSYAGSSRKFKIAVLVFLLIYGASHLWNSTNSLSLERRTAEFGWGQNFGLYRMERDEGGFSFRWTKKSAGISVENTGAPLKIPIMASHPDIEKNPVFVKIYTADLCFKNRRLAGEIVLDKNEWRDFDCPIPGGSGEKIHIIFEVSRTWQPQRDLNIPDPRQLGIAIALEEL